MIYTERPPRYGIIIEFSCDNGLDMELILGEVEAALVNSAPHVYDVSSSVMEEEDL